MPFQHYLPATYIACFSHGEDNKRRDRVVAVGNRKEGNVWETKAGSVAGINNLYTTSGLSDQAEIVDKNWAFYEASLATALEKVINGTIDAEIWGRVIIPFVAGILVRGPDFSERYKQRQGNLIDIVHPDSVNISRVFEFQVMLANLISSEWLIASTIGHDELITNDLGYAPFVIERTREIGISIPIGKRHIIQIIPRRISRVAVNQSGQWVPVVKHVQLVRDNHLGFNRALAKYSQQFIFGSSKELIQKHLCAEQTIRKPLEPYQIGFRFGGDEAKYAWYRFISMVSSNAMDTSSNQADINNLFAGPTPSILFLSSDLYTDRSTVYQRGRFIYVDLKDLGK